MRKFWAVFKHEYARHVLRKRFILALVSVPLWIVFAIGLGIVSVFLQMDRTPVGYVDQAGIIKQTESPLLQSSGPVAVDLLRIESEEEARQALDEKQIQAFFLLPANYLETRSARLFFYEEPDDSVISQFNDLLRINLLANKPTRVVLRALQGPQLVVEATSDDRSMAENDWGKVAAPIAAGIFLTVAVFTSSGYLMQAVVEEKENRTMEILATSLSPVQIMGGKIAALISVGLTQIFIWSVFPAILLGVAVAYIPFLQDISIDWNTILLVLITALPTFVLVAAIMAMIGASVTEASEGQQVSGLVTLIVMAPFMLMTPILMNPSGPIALFFSFFPLTASLTLLARVAFSSVPDWQIAVSAVILTISAIGALWMAGRVFRLGMLQYGQRLGLKDIFNGIRKGTAYTPASRKNTA